MPRLWTSRLALHPWRRAGMTRSRNKELRRISKGAPPSMATLLSDVSSKIRGQDAYAGRSTSYTRRHRKSRWSGSENFSHKVGKSIRLVSRLSAAASTRSETTSGMRTSTRSVECLSSLWSTVSGRRLRSSWSTLFQWSTCLKLMVQGAMMAWPRAAIHCSIYWVKFRSWNKKWKKTRTIMEMTVLMLS